MESNSGEIRLRLVGEFVQLVVIAGDRALLVIVLLGLDTVVDGIEVDEVKVEVKAEVSLDEAFAPM